MFVKAGRDLYVKPGTAFARNTLSLCVYDGRRAISSPSSHSISHQSVQGIR